MTQYINLCIRGNFGVVDNIVPSISLACCAPVNVQGFSPCKYHIYFTAKLFSKLVI